ncbi:hypothetical protein [Candidatus Magnetominusculus xianensis]|uniref:Hydrogenase n=1 Tax=Candidatus Magnetominusculus xianensis TaxID=1748249 RepID=A0ABR5SEY4_9BACT|nr:hypothetical protein [Candidatus Magnetominusculus xianensis]KWT85080.1 hydrogenase [Candidatus Magnetominusculus xianensis]MBF0402459.1 hypothetical protein [Nitrospirota bacterium]
MIHNLVVVLFGVTLLYISTTSRLGAYIKVLSVQGLLLFLFSLSHAGNMKLGHTMILAFETLVVKAAVTPLFIHYIIEKLDIKRVTEPYIDNFISLIVATAIISVSFVLSVALRNAGSGVDVLTFSISISAVVIGLFIVITNQKLITHVMGFLVLENGVFMMSLSLASEVPVVVEAGVLLDVFMGVFLMGIFLNRMKSTFESSDVTLLRRLKD